MQVAVMLASLLELTVQLSDVESFLASVPDLRVFGHGAGGKR